MNKITLIVPAEIKGSIDDYRSPPVNRWEIHPEITGVSGTEKKYLILEQRGEKQGYIFGWLEKVGVDSIYHVEISEQWLNYIPVGGGFLEVRRAGLCLNWFSTQFGYPPLNLLKDAARAVVATMQPFTSLEQVLLHGEQYFEISFST